MSRLLRQRADVNYSHTFRHNWTPLHAAVYYGQKEAIKFLLATGADVNHEDTWADRPARSPGPPEDSASAVRDGAGSEGRQARSRIGAPPDVWKYVRGAVSQRQWAMWRYGPPAKYPRQANAA